LVDEVIVYGGLSSHRVLPSSFGANNPKNKVVNGTDGQGHMNPENRFVDSDERAVYQEALQVWHIVSTLRCVFCFLPSS
jgi:hypothetical protein